MECTNIYSIVEDLQKKTMAKASKQAKRGGTVSITISSTTANSAKEESFYCTQIHEWHSEHPKYETQTISSVPMNETYSALHPVAIKLKTESSNSSPSANETAVVISFTAALSSGHNTRRNRVNVIETTVSNGTTYSIKAALGKSQTYKLGLKDGQGRTKDFTINIRSIGGSSAVVELNYDNAVPNDLMTNLILCGYQGWFAYPGDGSPIDKWKHWFNAPQDPSLGGLTVEMYPYNDEYDDDDLKGTNILMKDGSKAKLFSSARPNVVKKHFEWMRDYGISGVFHMRFMQDIDKVSCIVVMPTLIECFCMLTIG
jgi:hypothetical protein